MASATPTTVSVSFNPTAINIQSDVIGPASPFAAGVMTAAQVQQLSNASAASPQTTTPIVVDNNAVPVPGSVPTLAEALASNANLIQLKLSATPYVWPTGTYFLPRPVKGGTPLAIEGELSAPLVNGTVQGGDVTTPAQIADGTLAMTPGAFRGKFVRVTLPFVGTVMSCIVDNNATEVFFQSPIGPPAAAGTTWEIVEPAVTIEFPDTDSITVQDGNISFSKVNLLDPANDAFVTFVNAGVSVDTSTMTGFFGGGDGGWNVVGAASSFLTPLSGGAVPGIYINSSIMILHDGAIHAARIVADDFGSWSSNLCSHTFVDVNARGVDIEAFGECKLQFTNTNGNLVKSTLDGDLFGAGFLVLLDGNSFGFSGSGASGEVVMQNSSGSGMLLLRGSYARMGNVTGTNTTAGFELNLMARLTRGSSTVAGAAPGSDILFDGSSTLVAYGSLPFVDSTTDLSQAA